MKVRKMRSKLLLSMLLMVAGTGAFAQRAKYMAELPQPAASGFYHIALPPQILAKANAGLSDVRITGPNGTTVPYLFGESLPIDKGTDVFVPFKQVGQVKQDTVTTFIVQNAAESTSIGQLVLKLRNMDVERRVILAGSDDLKNWYAIKEDITLTKAGDDAHSKGVYEQLLSFPSSNYNFYRIRVNNLRRDPVAIIEAGIYRSQMIEKPAYWPLEGLRFGQKDSAKVSRVFIKLADNYRVDRLWLSLAGAKYYQRAMRVYEVKGRYRNLLSETFITSSDETSLSLSAKTNLLALEIDNEDNAPLKVTKVAAFQLQQSLIAYLDAGKNYQLGFGDTTAVTPNYDLRFFADSVKKLDNARVIMPGPVKVNPQQPIAKPASKSFPAWALWAIIVAVLTALGAMTFKMTKEVGKRG
ncbi:DUF3999 family protein [Mucilaginibacter psychrotolerans]|uniref:DUF3999 family protein n=1 Tax=Mucilaginibacter psychrotolerans TaxID=1524096 RepID=A0A4Y8SDH6_9SPHI|nr:DUF3999 family protein [Mucilaginibacter psychrotolerans]TFF37133.1 DUF3999 family protein [Mucilaginibacter psychrotolerans]